MRALTWCADASATAVALFKKVAAVALLTIANFLNTWMGKLSTVILLLGVTYAAWHYEHIALFPVFFHMVNAGWRRGLFFTVVVLLTPRQRRFLRNTARALGARLKRKWGSLPLLVRVSTHLTIAVVLGLIALHYLQVWNVGVQVLAILPIPVFLSVYIGEKLPRLIVAFVQRQGVGTIVFDGGWHLFPPQARIRLRRANFWLVRKIAGPRKHVMDRWRSQQLARRERLLTSARQKPLPASD